MVRIDMSEYMERHAVSRLIGAPPGYVGYEQGGQLTEAVRRKPYSVILFDEIEKAHPEVFNVLLQLLDDGRLTDNQGHVVDFKNTVVIMTSNIGSNVLLDYMAQATADQDIPIEIKEQIMNLMHQTFKPELLNRIDEIVLFTPLTIEAIKGIVDLVLDQLRHRLAERHMTLEVRPVALEKMAQDSYNPVFGARPVKRFVQSVIETQLGKALIADRFKEGDDIIIDYRDGDYQFTIKE